MVGLGIAKKYQRNDGVQHGDGGEGGGREGGSRVRSAYNDKVTEVWPLLG